MIYTTKMGLKSLNISKIQVGKCDSFFGYEPKLHLPSNIAAGSI